MPTNIPTAAGTTLNLPIAEDISMLGISRDHTEAATITPEANPNNVFCSLVDISSFIKNTKDAPNIVPKNGMTNDNIISKFMIENSRALL